ncbi:adenosine deaminase [Leifsonia sp. Leaf264]|nr:adenosine deaminase [Leifsonia sp. Leaf264]
MHLPIAELHLHLEGTLEPEFILEAAARNGVELPWTSLADLRSRYDFTDLQSFLDLLYTNLEVLQTSRDFEQMTRDYLRRASAGGVRHAEVSFDAQAHLLRGIPLEVVLTGIHAALDAGESEFGITSKLIVSFWRDRPASEAVEILQGLIDSDARIDGIGLDSAEVGYPPALFVELYDLARSHGLHVVAHAGEEGPAQNVADSLDLLKVERIDHGNNCLDDERLVARMVAERVPMTVCPLSNVRLRTIDTLARHPLPVMLEKGLFISINSDDPAYFGGYADANVAAVTEQFALDDATLELLARNSVDASFLDAAGKARLHGEIDDWVRSR